MKFHIFSKAEIYGKAFIYIIALGTTCGLLKYYFSLTEENNTFTFVISIVYALFLFLITIPINKLDKFTEEKLNDRKSYYLSLKRLREVMNATICKIDTNDFENMRMEIISFQVFTGRDSATLEKLALGEKTHTHM